MKIRKAKKEDLDEIGRLMIKELSKPPWNEKTSIKNILKSLNFYFKIGKIHVCLIDKKIIGVLVFKIEIYWEGKVIIIEDLVIEKKFQKQNIEKLLIEEIESYAKNKKIKKIIFDTFKKSSAIKFYQKQNYKIIKNIISMEKIIK